MPHATTAQLVNKLFIHTNTRKMKPKIFLIDERENEIPVATFENNIDALQCASFMQATLFPNTKKQFVVDINPKEYVAGINPKSRRVHPDDIKTVIENSNTLPLNIYK